MKTTKVKAKLDNRGRVVGYIDQRTGEEYGFPVIFGRKRNPYGNGWIMNSQKALDIIAEDKDLKGNTLRVFIKVCARVDFENWVHLPLKELSEELGIHKPDISQSIKQLVQKGILIRSDKIGRSYAYRLNPDFGWKGKVKNLDEYRKERDEQMVKDHQQKQIRSSLEIIKSKNKENVTSKIISLLESENVDLDKLNEFIEQKRKRGVMKI